ncbi:MAG: hypothetical protein IKB95_10090, partial [Bacteroidales bacterium]|nr:hypothetical protein [Bacteroidales bacterium]
MKIFMMNDYRNKYFEMQTSNPLTDLAEMDGLLYIHINICDSWRHSYLGSESKYIFLYKISTRELSGMYLNALLRSGANIVGGSADLGGSTNVRVAASR